jgi:tRNA (guanosine-2'-O-)-methyltransferase
MTPERIARLRAVLDSRQPDLTVITDFVHKQRNASAIVRNCDAVGIMTAHAVVDKRDYRAFRGTAMGSHRWVKVIRHETLDDAIAAVRADGMQVVAAHLSEQATDFRKFDYTRPTALLLGAEKAGVSELGAAAADVHVTIPMVGMVGSYNVSVAAGIILAEAQRQRQLAGLYDFRRIDDETYQRLFFEWGHPSVRRFCEERGLAYPPLNAEGEIDDPSGWYARVRESLGPGTESSAGGEEP